MLFGGFMESSNWNVLIIGGGSGGISVAARLRNFVPTADIAIIDSAEVHYYQPLWTLVGAGVKSKAESGRPMKDLIPSGVTRIKDRVSAINATQNSVTLESGKVLNYKYLVVAPGLRLRWDRIQGLEGNLGKSGICTIYEVDHVEQTQKLIESFKGGTALFVMPPVPIKCAGAPQKIMYLAEQIFRRNGIRDRSQVIFATAGKAMFGIPIFAEALRKIVDERGIQPRFEHKIIGVDATQKVAIFEVPDGAGGVRQERIAYDLLHVVPPMSAPAFITDSELAFQDGDQKGWLEVDRGTLQHKKYPNIFGVGDVTGVPNSKTGAAIRKQAPIVVSNLRSIMNGQLPTEVYDGYSSCPLTTEFGKVMLAEFGYDGKLMPTFPLDPSVPRRSMWLLKTTLLPILYWYGMLKGRA